MWRRPPPGTVRSSSRTWDRATRSGMDPTISESGMLSNPARRSTDSRATMTGGERGGACSRDWNRRPRRSAPRPPRYREGSPWSRERHRSSTSRSRRPTDCGRVARARHRLALVDRLHPRARPRVFREGPDPSVPRTAIGRGTGHRRHRPGVGRRGDARGPRGHAHLDQIAARRPLKETSLRSAPLSAAHASGI